MWIVDKQPEGKNLNGKWGLSAQWAWVLGPSGGTTPNPGPAAGGLLNSSLDSWATGQARETCSFLLSKKVDDKHQSHSVYTCVHRKLLHYKYNLSQLSLIEGF